jgi:hypothetical protein
MRSLLLIAVMLLVVFVASYADADSPSAASDGPRLDVAVFQFEQQAQLHCPEDSIVWVVASRGTYNASAERWYGRTSNGAYACHQDAERAGYHASMSRQ